MTRARDRANGLGGAAGGNGERALFENEVTIDSSYTISTNFNAVSAGPVTIASGATVTVPSGSVWVVL